MTKKTTKKELIKKLESLIKQFEKNPDGFNKLELMEIFNELYLTAKETGGVDLKEYEGGAFFIVDNSS